MNIAQLSRRGIESRFLVEPNKLFSASFGSIQSSKPDVQVRREIHLRDPRSRRHGDIVRIAIQAIIFGPSLSIEITDHRVNTHHSIDNTRFNYQSRDSHVDLLIRSDWRSEWRDCFRGAGHRVPPDVSGVPLQTPFFAIASRGPAFCAIGFDIGSDYIQFAARMRPGSSGAWARRYVDPHPPISPVVGEVDDSSGPASAHQSPQGEPDALERDQANCDRTFSTPKGWHIAGVNH